MTTFGGAPRHPLALLACLGFLMALAGQPVQASTDLNLTDTAGVQHSLKAYRGKWVVVNFWATWCTPCLAEMPDFDAAWQARKGRDLVVLGIAMDWDDKAEVARFAAKVGAHYPIVLGNEDIATELGGIKGLPTTLIYDPAGKLVHSSNGKLSRQQLEQFTHAP